MKQNNKQPQRTIIDWLRVMLLLLDEAVVLAIFYVILYFLGVRIPLYLNVIIGLFIFVIVLIMHVAVIPSFHLRKVSGWEGMIGMKARVVRALEPGGLVKIEGEDWQAKSSEGNIGLDEEVEVTGINGLLLTVRRVEEGDK